MKRRRESVVIRSWQAGLFEFIVTNRQPIFEKKPLLRARTRDHTPMLLKLQSQGRGRDYSISRGLVESTLHLVYRGNWPGRLWGLSKRAQQVRVVRTNVEARGIPPLRIAFASDLHLGPTTSPKTLHRAFELLAEAQPDVLLLGGDYVFLHGTPEKARELRRLVESVKARHKFAVLGNHDLWTTHQYLENALSEAGAKMLTNASSRLSDPHNDVAIVGIDDPWTGTPNVAQAFEGAANAAIVFVLCHAPEGLPLCEGRSFSLYLCGHTHGGHVATPIGAPVIPGRIGRALVAGEHQTKWGRAIISRGVGGIEVPFRTWAPPDIVIVDVVAPNA